VAASPDPNVSLETHLKDDRRVGAERGKWPPARNAVCPYYGELFSPCPHNVVEGEAEQAESSISMSGGSAGLPATDA
jgi:hypothetical protein